MSSIPIIDLSAIMADTETPEMLAELDTACRDHGFFLVKGHGLDEKIERLWADTKQFFDRPRSEKAALSRDANSPMGYFDRELTKQKRDQKEVFDFIGEGRDFKNHWPEHDPEFRANMLDYFNACMNVAERIASALCKTLQLPSDAMAPVFGPKQASFIRLNHYPENDPVAVQDRTGINPLGDMALHHHTDPGMITLLLQDGVGGLQTLSKDGWIDVPPVPGTIIVNLSDMLQVWTNNQYKAAIHRVLPVEQSRYSVPFFYQPNMKAEIAPIDALSSGSPEYRPFMWRDFINARAEGNFDDYGEETQISDFSIAPTAVTA